MLSSGRRGDKFLALVLGPWIMSAMLRHGSARMAATALAYTGPAKLEQRYGPIEVRGLDAFVANCDIGPEAAAQVRLFGGELWWDFLFLESEIDDNRAPALADAVLAYLRAASETSAEESQSQGAPRDGDD
jgi:hypothetical protein